MRLELLAACQRGLDDNRAPNNSKALSWGGAIESVMKIIFMTCRKLESTRIIISRLVDFL